MNLPSTWHIHIGGQVQGVGFRPFIYQLAQKFDLTGWVNNSFDGIHIEFNASETDSKQFYEAILLQAPQHSSITSHSLKKTSSILYEEFQIILSSTQGKPVVLISPDLAICSNCSREIIDKTNRRHNYAFTTCTQCGPRYSIIGQLPYDRDNTAMEVFTMCPICKTEYHDPMNRRHYSQTNSCSHCPVVMKLYDHSQKVIEENQVKIISKICRFWEEGKIVAIKGIGGYILTCDASNSKAIKELRARKHRPAKPLALMFPNIISLEKEVHLNETEIAALQSVVSPIVILQLKNKITSEIAFNEIAPGLSSIGVMLPYAGLYQLLLQQFSRPIVATSGNLSHAPIIHDEPTALKELSTIADFILVHNREIIASQDDSVIKYSNQSLHRVVLRRARGLAPLYNNQNLLLPETTILATGASLKSTFALLDQQNIHVSEYLGDTDNYDTQKNFEKKLHHFLKMFQATPEIILVDDHPDYFTTQLGKQLAKKWNSQLVSVQHHEAHFASVLGENCLLNDAEPLLGVIWDGTGLGNDNQIWGGEFFVFHQRSIKRVAHFDYYNHFLSDKMAFEPRLSAFSLCYEMEEATSILQSKFNETEWNNYQKLIKANNLKTSSVGRMFDAVASLLGLIDKSSYEGEAAMLLEERALVFFNGKMDIPASWLKDISSGHMLSTRILVKEVITMIAQGKDSSEIAAWFHVHLVLVIKEMASYHNYKKICFSGGVFQNGLLTDLAIKILGGEYQLFFNKELSPNDENISFGQIMMATMMSPIINKIA